MKASNNYVQLQSLSNCDNDDDDSYKNVFSTKDEYILIDLNQRTYQWWSKMTIYLSFFSIVITLTLGIFGLVITSKSGSIALLGLSFDSLLDLLSSILIIWRFWKIDEVLPSSCEQRDIIVSSSREHRAEVSIALIFIVFSSVLFLEGTIHLVKHKAPIDHIGLRRLAIASIVLDIFLGVVKLVLAKKLKSKAVRSDAFTTFSGALIGVSILISYEAYRKIPSMWWMDSLLSMLLAVLILGIGIKSIYSYPVFTKAFWTGSAI